jgi:DNA-binding NarL/FixJ family response regulator
MVPDIVFLDIGLPDMSGIGLLDQIRRMSANTRVVVLSCQTDEASIQIALNAGVCGYLTKSASPRDIVDAVRRVRRGQIAMTADVVTQLASRAVRNSNKTGRPTLTVREREVWAELARGLSNREIAQSLFLSEHTVKFHVHNLLSKLGLKSRAEAVYVAHRREVTFE